MSTTRNAADHESHITVDFPPIFGYDRLATLLGRTVASLQADRCRKPLTLPPACTPPGTKSPRWLLSDVLGWLAQHREPQQQPPKDGEAEVRPTSGRPTKGNQIAARRRAAAGAAA